VQLEQQFDLDAPPARTWPAFRDVALMVECLPGASLTGEAVDGEVPLRFDVRLGPVAVAFVGAGRLSLDEPAHGGRFEGAAADRRTNSRVKGAAAFTVAPADDGNGSRVSVSIEYALTGTLAQIGRPGIVREVAGALTAQFAANLSARLRAEPVPRPGPEAVMGREPGEGVALRTPAPASTEPAWAVGPAAVPGDSAGASRADPTDLDLPRPDAPRTGIPSADPRDLQPIATQPIGTPPIATQPIGTQPIGTPPIGTPQPARRPGAAPSTSATVPLSAGALLAAMLKARLRRLLDRILGRTSP